ncbi:MAG: hypothetical protein H0T20_01600 [Actinobacteria bacterium]|nr:hypothetical protein [Actinomycetota bacterium]
MAAVRAPHLYRSLRCFCLGAFHVLSAEDVDLPFAFEQHASRGRPVLYEYRPLVRDFVEARARKLESRQDAQLAVQDLRAEPAAAIFGEEPFKSVLLPLILRVSESCGGFDWDDSAFDRAYEELEQTLFSGRRAYAAVAPVIGLSLGGELALAEGLCVRHAATGELAKHWPEAQALLPPEFGRDTDRLCVVELQRELAAGENVPDAAGEIGDAVTAVRLATSGAIAAGPVLFERVDWRPFGIEPMLPIAAAQPGGEATRLDPFRGRLAAELLERLPLADEDPELGEALDRWELSLFQSGSSREEQLREALTALLGGMDGVWAATMRASVLLGDRVDEPRPDIVRRAIVETLMHGDRPGLVRALDDAMLGLREAPAGYFARATA